MKDLINIEKFEFNISIQKIEILFCYFFNNTIFSVILFLLSIIYIFWKEDNKKIKDIFGWYVIIIILIIWNPLVIHILEEFINFASMYRLYYMLPMYLIIAYVFSKIVENFEKSWMRYLCVFGICGIVVLFGKNVFDEWPLNEYNNLYKLPDETVFVAEAIYRDNKYEHYKKAIVPYGISSQIQQIHPSIDLVYTRVVTNVVDDDGIPSPSDTDFAGDNEMIKRINEGETRYIADLCERAEVNYVAMYDSIPLQESLEQYGFEVINKDYRNYSL